MAHYTEVVILLIVATAPTALATDFEQIVKAEERRVNSRCSDCCPFGWVKYEERCYIYQTNSMDWASAEDHCLTLGGHLVSIHTENEYQLVKALIRVHDSQENPIWLGLNGCQKRNIFFWSDGTKLTFTKWNPSEPNFTDEECCVHIDYGGKQNWNDISCLQNYAFVCAKWLY